MSRGSLSSLTGHTVPAGQLPPHLDPHGVLPTLALSLGWIEGPRQGHVNLRRFNKTWSGQTPGSIQAEDEQMEQPWEKELRVLVGESRTCPIPEPLVPWAEPPAWVSAKGLCPSALLR